MLHIHYQKLFFLILIQNSFSDIPSYKCIKDKNTDTSCYLYRLQLTSSTKNFKLIPHRSAYHIDKFGFRRSSVEVLTSDICEALPHIETFSAPETDIVSVEKDAFRKCIRLTDINLSENLLKTIPVGVFDSNKRLENLWLHNNQLNELDLRIFKNNINLEGLFIERNQIKNLSYLNEMPKLRELKKFVLSVNQLPDINIEMLLEKCTNLESIDLTENKISCERQYEIYRLLRLNNIEYEDIEECDDYEITTQPILREKVGIFRSNRQRPRTTKQSIRKLSPKHYDSSEDYDEDEESFTINISSYSSSQCESNHLISGFVVNGERKNEVKYPWVAAMFIDSEYKCNANFISRTRAITAAHCFVNKPKANDIILLLYSNECKICCCHF